MVPVMDSPVSLHYAVLGMLSGRPRCADDAYGDAVDMLWPTEMTRMGTVFVQALTALHQQVGCQMPLVQRGWAWCSADLAAHIATWDEQQQAWAIPVTDLSWGFVLYQVVMDLCWYGATMVYEAFEGVLVIIRLPLTPFAEQLVALPWPWDDPANGALDTRPMA